LHYQDGHAACQKLSFHLFSTFSIFEDIAFMSTKFIHGLDLSERYYHEIVQPILAARFGELPYAAARMHRGSEVLGYDDLTSADHCWGPIVEIYLAPEDYAQYADKIREVMTQELPREFAGYPTFLKPPNFNFKASNTEPVQHAVYCFSLDTLVGYRRDCPAGFMTAVDWLMTPQQRLRCLRSGRVFHDATGEVTAIRQLLHWYPRDIWLYLMACQWHRIGQEHAFLGRCGDVGDELGSRLVAGRLIHDLMCLCFLMEKQYAPYAKWFGRAFADLDCANELTPLFHKTLDAQSWQERQDQLCPAYQYVAAMHNALGIGDPLSTEIGYYYDRPYKVLQSAFDAVLFDAIESAEVQALPRNVGSIDQFVNSTDVLDWDSRRLRLRAMYEDN
jgi:hypothetical protein